MKNLCVTRCPLWLRFFYPGFPKWYKHHKIRHTDAKITEKCHRGVIYALFMAAAPQQITPPIDDITRRIIGAAMKVHTALGPGLLESAYRVCLMHELRKHRLNVASEVGLPVIYQGERIDLGYRIDLIVQDSVIVEIKCVEAINAVHKSQLLSYMRLSGRQVGLLINFHVEHLRDGIRRMVDGYGWQKSSTTEDTELHRGTPQRLRLPPWIFSA